METADYPTNPPDPSTPLGLIVVSKDALDQDWKVNEGYISYSAELLRLSLLMMTGIATLCLKLSEHRPFGSTIAGFRWGLACLAVAVASAVAHRYLAVDSLHYQIKSLRLSIRRRPAGYRSDFDPDKRGDIERAKSERGKMKFRFCVATWLLRFAGSFLFLGVVFSAWHLTKL
jgi:hypothetical protein